MQRFAQVADASDASACLAPQLESATNPVISAPKAEMPASANSPTSFFMESLQVKTISPFHGLRVAPQPFEVVIHARLLRKNVDQEIAVIHQHPFGVLVAFDACRVLALLFQRLLDLIRDRLDLPGVRS